MASLNVDLNYFDHPKTMRLAARLGPGSDVLPIRLWAYVGRHHPESGSLALLESELEHICGWWGDKGEMVTAMIEIGFLKRDGDFFQINDWHEHSGHLATFKKRAVKAARKRWGIKKKSSNASSIAKREPKQSPSSAVQCSALPTQQAKIQHLEFVWLTPDEIGKLKQNLGEKRTQEFIERLNGYIGQIGQQKGSKKYTSHYHTILNWYRKDKLEAETAFAPIKPPVASRPYVESRPKDEDIIAPEDVRRILSGIAKGVSK